MIEPTMDTREKACCVLFLLKRINNLVPWDAVDVKLHKELGDVVKEATATARSVVADLREE